MAAGDDEGLLWMMKRHSVKAEEPQPIYDPISYHQNTPNVHVTVLWSSNNFIDYKRDLISNFKVCSVVQLSKTCSSS